MELLTPFTFDMSVNDFIERSLFFEASEFILECKSLPLTDQWIKDLNTITYGQRIDLSDLNSDNFIMLPLKVLHNIENVGKMKIGEVLRFSFMVADGLSDLNERDEKYLVYDLEPEELKAGVKKLNHGLFGIIDNIAKRCPQYTHDEILNLSQATVFQMLKIDIDNMNYQKRLRKILAESHKK